MRGINFFTDHPASVGETYWQHFKFAVKVFLSLLKAAFTCLIHAIFPPLFPKTASSEIRSLHADLEKRQLAQSVNDESHVALGNFQHSVLRGTE